MGRKRKPKETLTSKRQMRVQTIPLRDYHGWLWERTEDPSYQPKLVFCPMTDGLRNKNKCFTCDHFAAIFESGVKCAAPKQYNPPYYYNRLKFQAK